ncbi:MAG: AAA family ATPase [Pseudomonadota bacterium]|nr:AAA family ATPase [Pseudomonadota bacterium]
MASYVSAPETLTNLSMFTYIFGANGAGKSTIGRVVAEPGAYPNCSVTWKGGAALEALVYNQDFITRNLSSSTEWKGVFTLGEQQVDIEKKISAAAAEVETVDKKLASLRSSLDGADGKGGKRGELASLEEECAEACWKLKVRFEGAFRDALTGFRGSSQSFKRKLLDERASNRASIVPLADLTTRASTLFGVPPSMKALLPAIDGTRLVGHEANPILRKKVVGKDDVDIAAIIKKLGNSDWVRQGRAFFERNDQVCPFCQQTTPDHFEASLNEYFDATYTSDVQAIETLAAAYAADATRTLAQFEALVVTPPDLLDAEKLKAAVDTLRAAILVNRQRVEEKRRESSQVVALEPLGEALDACAAVLSAANVNIAKHNTMVADFTTEKSALIRDVWRLLVAEAEPYLVTYDARRKVLFATVTGMETSIQKARGDLQAKQSVLAGFEKMTTSIQPTIDAINAMLDGFGFRGFTIAKSTTANSYRLLRADGSNASATLSEGERTFVSFLYFYHLLKGSLTTQGVTTNRVVVFDDPVSSLDADVLFIVSTLIRELIEDVRVGKHQARQVFVLTHNVYFHKEVTFNMRRQPGTVLNEESFWVVRKPEGISSVERQTSNPVRTSYDLLWEEVRRNDERAGVQNTLRRILENYFKILGGVPLHELCSSFAGVDKLICKSLISWVNDGSHNAQDDLDAPTNHTPKTYLRVFRAIFETRGHGAHYRMMMGNAYVEPPPTEPPALKTVNMPTPVASEVVVVA